MSFASDNHPDPGNRYSGSHDSRRDTVGAPMEILLIEDSLTDARLTIGSLASSELRHRTTLVRDGEEALEFLHRRGKFAQAPRPDLVLLDLFLPKIDGIQLLGAIREDFDLRSLPVVVLTGSLQEEDKNSCELLSVEAYLHKPVDLENFLAVVRKLKNHWREDLVLPE